MKATVISHCITVLFKKNVCKKLDIIQSMPLKRHIQSHSCLLHLRRIIFDCMRRVHTPPFRAF
jgi:hypothetical protein